MGKAAGIGVSGDESEVIEDTGQLEACQSLLEGLPWGCHTAKPPPCIRINHSVHRCKSASESKDWRLSGRQRQVPRGASSQWLLLLDFSVSVCQWQTSSRNDVVGARLIRDGVCVCGRVKMAGRVFARPAVYR